MTDLFGIIRGGEIRKEVIDLEEKIILNSVSVVIGVLWRVEKAIIKKDVDKNDVVKGMT